MNQEICCNQCLQLIKSENDLKFIITIDELKFFLEEYTLIFGYNSMNFIESCIKSHTAYLCKKCWLDNIQIKAA
jgi:hypothetical protein